MANTAAGLQRMFKRTPELADRAWHRLHQGGNQGGDRLGSCTKKARLAVTLNELGSKKGTEVPTTLTEIGLNKKRAARALKLAAMPAETSGNL